MIGRECKYSNVLSGPILIGRGLNQNRSFDGSKYGEAYNDFTLARGYGNVDSYAVVNVSETYSTNSGDDGEREPPVLIPNTEVKPFRAESTELETAWEDRALPDSIDRRRI